MTSEKRSFMYDNGFIRLDDLENWYVHGWVTPNDQIRVFEEGKKSYSVKISALIETYGAEFPFRMIPRSSKSSEVLDSEPSGKFEKFETPVNQPNYHRGPTPFSYIPLLNTKKVEDSKTLTNREINLLLILGKNAETQFENMYLADVFKSVMVPDFCELCNSSIPASSFHLVTHILSKAHLKNLGQFPVKDINFWIHLRALDIHKTIKQDDVVRCLTHRNSPSIPLFDYELERKLPKGEKGRTHKLNELRRIFKNREPNSKWDIGIDPTNVKCYFCDSETFKSEVELLEHLFSEQHWSYLLRFGFPTESVEWWQAIFDPNSKNSPTFSIDSGRDLRSELDDKEPLEIGVWKGAPEEKLSENSKLPEEVEENEDVESESSENQREIEKSDNDQVCTSILENCGNDANSLHFENPVFSFVPFLNTNKTKDSRKLLKKEKNLLVSLGKIAKKLYEKMYLADAFNGMPVPKTCPLCQITITNSTLTQTKTSTLVTHILSKSHLNKLQEVSPSEINFWRNLRLLGPNKSEKREDVIRFLTLRNSSTVPLFDFECERNLNRKINETKVLKEMYELSKDEDWIPKLKSLVAAKNVACFACNFERGSFNDEIELVDHLFSEQHLKYLTEFGFPRSAIQWWRNIFDSTGRVYSQVRSRLRSIRKMKIASMSGGKMMKMTETVRSGLNSIGNKKPVNFEKMYITEVFELIDVPIFCEFCNFDISKSTIGTTSTTVKFLKHILSNEHLLNIREIPEPQFQFFENIRRLEGFKRNGEKRMDIVRFLTCNNSPLVPLFDFELESVLVQKKKQKDKKLEELRRFCGLFKTGNWILELKKSIVAKNVACFACDFKIGSFKNEFALVEHLFSKQHMNYLLEFGFPESAVEWWKTVFKSTRQNFQNYTIERWLQDSNFGNKFYLHPKPPGVPVEVIAVENENESSSEDLDSDSSTHSRYVIPIGDFKLGRSSKKQKDYVYFK